MTLATDIPRRVLLVARASPVPQGGTAKCEFISLRAFSLAVLADT